ncbi:hypothetical protein [Nocardia sp. NPDC050793]|uniref:hypothetical protein n=1 Tax=Nocardia sp. NPDC050793 TaxID=3155159 RepID=UPI0033E9322F
MTEPFLSRRHILGWRGWHQRRRARLPGFSTARAGAAPARRQPAPSGTSRIDLHAHVLPPDYRAALLAHGHFTIGGYPTPTVYSTGGRVIHEIAA